MNICYFESIGKIDSFRNTLNNFAIQLHNISSELNGIVKKDSFNENEVKELVFNTENFVKNEYLKTIDVKEISKKTGFNFSAEKLYEVSEKPDLSYLLELIKKLKSIIHNNESNLIQWLKLLNGKFEVDSIKFNEYCNQWRKFTNQPEKLEKLQLLTSLLNEFKGTVLNISNPNIELKKDVFYYSETTDNIVLNLENTKL